MINFWNGAAPVNNLINEIHSIEINNNGDDNWGDALWHSHGYTTNLGIGGFGEVELRPTKLSDLQSVVLYNRVGSSSDRAIGISVQLIREKNLSVFNNITFNRVKIKRTTNTEYVGTNAANHKTYIRMTELQVWMYDGSTLTNIALPPIMGGIGSINTSESVDKYSDNRGHGLINNNDLIISNDNEGFISKTGTEIGDDVVLDFSSTQNLSQLASIVFFSHFMNYYGKEPFTHWSYSSPGCSIQIYNDDTEIFSYELKSQKFAHRVDGPAIDSVPLNMFTSMDLIIMEIQVKLNKNCS